MYEKTVRESAETTNEFIYPYYVKCYFDDAASTPLTEKPAGKMLAQDWDHPGQAADVHSIPYGFVPAPENTYMYLGSCFLTDIDATPYEAQHRAKIHDPCLLAVRLYPIYCDGLDQEDKFPLLYVGHMKEDPQTKKRYVIPYSGVGEYMLRDQDLVIHTDGVVYGAKPMDLSKEEADYAKFHGLLEISKKLLPALFDFKRYEPTMMFHVATHPGTTPSHSSIHEQRQKG